MINVRIVIATSLLPLIVSESYALDCSRLSDLAQRASCQRMQTNVIPELTNGVSGDICGHNEEIIRCSFDEFIKDFYPTSNEQRPVRFSDEDIRKACDRKKRNYTRIDAHGSFAKEATIHGPISRDRVCSQRAPMSGSCILWKHTVEYTCKISVWTEVYRRDKDKCGTRKTTPKQCIEAHQRDHELIQDKLIAFQAISSLIENETTYILTATELATKLSVAKNDLSRFVYSPEDIKLLKAYVELLVERSVDPDEDDNLLEVTVLLEEIVQKIHTNSSTYREIVENIEYIEQQISVLNEEKEVKAAYLALVNKRIGELIEKQMEIASNL